MTVSHVLWRVPRRERGPFGDDDGDTIDSLRNCARPESKDQAQSGAFQGLGIGAGVRYIGETYGDDANSFTVPSVTLFDAALSYEWKSMEFQLNASNLFNKEYIASCSSTEAGCYPGEGRKIIGSIKHRW